MLGVTLEDPDAVKYLGIMLDSRLAFIPHIKGKAVKVNQLLFQLHKAVGHDSVLPSPNPQVTGECSNPQLFAPLVG